MYFDGPISRDHVINVQAFGNMAALEEEVSSFLTRKSISALLSLYIYPSHQD